MATSRELITYPQSYLDALQDLLDYHLDQYPNHGYTELRTISSNFRNSEQKAIRSIEQLPLALGNIKNGSISRYVPFFHNNFFIKYFVIPPQASTTSGVNFVLLESVVRQNSGVYNSGFIRSLPSIDISD